MREFIVTGHTATTEPDFSLNDLAGGAGRIDVLCRCVNSCFFLSHSLREDVRLHLVLKDKVSLRFEGSELQHLNPDERSTASLIKKALKKKKEAIGHTEVESTPGVYVSKRGFEDIIERVSGKVIELHEDGTPLAEIETPENPVFVLSDHEDFSRKEKEIIEDVCDETVSLGPETLHADHSITVSHNYLDTEGFENY